MITAADLKTQTVKELGELAKQMGVSGWHSMRKDQLVTALLDGCAELTRDSRRFMLLTCHSPGYGPAELHALLTDHVFGSCQQGGDASLLTIESVDGRRLPSGVVARWPG